MKSEVIHAVLWVILITLAFYSVKIRKCGRILSGAKE